MKAYFPSTILGTISALLSQSRIWVCGSILIFPCPNMIRMSAKVVLCNSVILDMSGGYLLMMLMYLWPMLLLVVGSQLDYCNSLFRSLSKFNLHKLQCIQNSAVRIISNTSRYTSITPFLKKLHWLPAEHRSVFKTATLVYKFLHTGFPKYFAPVPTVPGTVRVVVISLSFPSFNPQSINPSNNLVIVLLLMLPLSGMLFQRRFVRPPLLSPSKNASKPTFTPRHSLLSLTPGVLNGAWTLFRPWILKLVDCFCFVVP